MWYLQSYSSVILLIIPTPDEVIGDGDKTTIPRILDNYDDYIVLDV